MKPLLATVLFAAIFAPLAVPAAVVLTVDLSTPNQITITSTTGASIATVSGSDFTGIYLAELFATNTASANVQPAPTVSNGFSSFLDVPSEVARLYRHAPSNPNDRGLNVFDLVMGATANFTAGVQAFKGSATWTIPSGTYNLILANGASSGDVYFPADDFSDLQGATLIGTWALIPEPSRYVLIMAGLVGLLSVRQRR